MTDFEKEIVQKYLLPKQPFAHGLASAFDLFGTLDHGKNEQLLANLQEEFRQSDTDKMSAAWRYVGETLYWAFNQYEGASGESS